MSTSQDMYRDSSHPRSFTIKAAEPMPSKTEIKMMGKVAKAAMVVDGFGYVPGTPKMEAPSCPYLRGGFHSCDPASRVHDLSSCAAPYCRG